MVPPGKRAKNARSISLPALRQNYLVAMATSLDKLENKVQIHHQSAFIWWKNCENRSSTSGDIRRNMPNHEVNTQRSFG